MELLFHLAIVTFATWVLKCVPSVSGCDALPVYIRDVSRRCGDEVTSECEPSAINQNTEVESVDVVCSNIAFQVSVDDKKFQDEFPEVDPTELSLGTSECRSDSATGDIITWTYTLESCNVKRMITRENVIYSNILFSQDMLDANRDITRDNVWSLNVTCVMSRHLSADMDFSIKRDLMDNGKTVTIRSNVTLHLDVSADENFNSPASLKPTRNSSSSMTFTNIHMSNASEDKMLVLEEVVLMSNENISVKSNLHYLIFNRCPVDGNVRTFITGPRDVRFSFPARTYFGTDQDVYLHAYVLICDVTEVTCKRVCLSSREKRVSSRFSPPSLDTPDRRPNVHRVYCGPLYHSGSGTDEDEAKGLSPLFLGILFLVLILLLASIIFLIATIYRRRKIKRTLTEQANEYGTITELGGDDASIERPQDPMIPDEASTVTTAREDVSMLASDGMDDNALATSEINLVVDTDDTLPVGTDNPAHETDHDSEDDDTTDEFFSPYISAPYVGATTYSSQRQEPDVNIESSDDVIARTEFNYVPNVAVSEDKIESSKTDNRETSAKRHRDEEMQTESSDNTSTSAGSAGIAGAGVVTGLVAATAWKNNMPLIMEDAQSIDDELQATKDMEQLARLEEGLATLQAIVNDDEVLFSDDIEVSFEDENSYSETSDILAQVSSNTDRREANNEQYPESAYDTDNTPASRASQQKKKTTATVSDAHDGEEDKVCDEYITDDVSNSSTADAVSDESQFSRESSEHNEARSSVDESLLRAKSRRIHGSQEDEIRQYRKSSALKQNDVRVLEKVIRESRLLLGSEDAQVLMGSAAFIMNEFMLQDDDRQGGSQDADEGCQGDKRSDDVTFTDDCSKAQGGTDENSLDYSHVNLASKIECSSESTVNPEVTNADDEEAISAKSSANPAAMCNDLSHTKEIPEVGNTHSLQASGGSNSQSKVGEGQTSLKAVVDDDVKLLSDDAKVKFNNDNGVRDNSNALSQPTSHQNNTETNGKPPDESIDKTDTIEATNTECLDSLITTAPCGANEQTPGQEVDIDEEANTSEQAYTQSGDIVSSLSAECTVHDDSHSLHDGPLQKAHEEIFLAKAITQNDDCFNSLSVEFIADGESQGCNEEPLLKPNEHDRQDAEVDGAEKCRDIQDEVEEDPSRRPVLDDCREVTS